MPEVVPEKIKAYRAVTYRTRPDLRLKTIDEAVQFVNERGFIFFWPIKGIELPSLWAAVAGNRPVPDNHDDPAHITWDWKDHLLGKKRCYYGRLLRRRNMMVSLECLPFFYALSPNYGDPENDYLEQYRQGAMTLETRLVYEALLNKGALDTLSLRKEARLSAPESEGRFNRALDTLQIELKVLPVGISQAGAWRYAFIYDLLPRHLPLLQEQARSINELEARKQLVFLYLKSTGATPVSAIRQLFGWQPATLEKTLSQLAIETRIQRDFPIEGKNEEWVILPELV